MAVGAHVEDQYQQSQYQQDDGRCHIVLERQAVTVRRQIPDQLHGPVNDQQDPQHQTDCHLRQVRQEHIGKSCKEKQD